MRDAVSIPRIAALHPKVRYEVAATIAGIEAKFPANVKIRIVQGLRTKDEQDALYAQGRTKPGQIVTNAKFGQSFHSYGLAFDFAIMYDKDNNGSFETLSWNVNYDFDKDGVKDWQEVVIPFKSLGWRWGGDWGGKFIDNPHLERTFGYGWRDLIIKYNNKEFDEAKYLTL